MDVTGLLKAANDGDEGALERLVPMVYDELKWLAHRHLRKESSPRTLSTTALVHEAYVKLVSGPRLPDGSRHHFYGAASRAMRQVLVDEARRRAAAKRGGGAQRAELNAEDLPAIELNDDLVRLDDALERLAEADSRLARIVECRFFGGLTVDETAGVVQASSRTVKRDWRTARAWLYRELSRGGA